MFMTFAHSASPHIVSPKKKKKYVTESNFQSRVGLFDLKNGSRVSVAGLFVCFVLSSFSEQLVFYVSAVFG